MYTEINIDERKEAARKSIKGRISALGGSNLTIAACQGVTDHLIDSGKSAGTAVEKAEVFGARIIDAGMSMCRVDT